MQAPAHLAYEDRLDPEAGGIGKHSQNLETQLAQWRQDLIRTLLRAVLVLGFPAAIFASYNEWVQGRPWMGLVYWGVYAALVFVTLWKGATYPLQAGTLLFLMYVLGVLQLFSSGKTGDGRVLLLAFAASALTFFEWKTGLAMLGLATITQLVFAGLYATNQLTIPTDLLLIRNHNLPAWLSSIAVFLLLANMLAASENHLLSRFRQALKSAGLAQDEVERRMQTERWQREQTQRLAESESEQRRQLEELLAQIQEATASLNAATQEIQAATIQQTSGASEQSAAITQTTTTIEQMKALANQVALHASEMNRAAIEAVSVTQAGQQAVTDTIQSMEQIKAQVMDVTGSIHTLARHTQQIGEIINSVNDLAAQSNMLALNAAIEAARAGEAGQGFSIVAQEVRGLAHKSRQATEQVQTILSEIEKATADTVRAAEGGARGVELGVQKAVESSQSIQALGAVIEAEAQAAERLVVSGRQQMVGMEQVAIAMQNIQIATTQNLASTRQTEKAAEDLNELAQRLNERVAHHKG